VVWDPRGDATTRELAERLGARVVSHPFAGFGHQRQIALAACTQPWVLWIDADERPDGSFEADLRRAFGSPGAGAAAGWNVIRRTWFLGQRIRHCGWGDERLLRVFRREGARFDDAPVHERVAIEGKVEDLNAVLEHHSYESIESCEIKMHRYAKAGAEKEWARGRRAGAADVIFRPPLRFLRQYVLQLGFLDGAAGAVLCAFAAAQVLLKYARLWQRTRVQNRAGAD
jgi:hypothetical protein